MTEPRNDIQPFKNYAAMDGMRGYAALLVTLTHFLLAYMGGFRSIDLAHVTFASLQNGEDRLYLWLALNMQSLYVLLTISGFMVCRMVMRRTYVGFGRFILGRSLRILPPFLFSLVFAVLVARAMSAPLRLDIWDITYNVLMLNGIFEISGQPYNFPSWTLFYETIYCLLVPGMVAMAVVLARLRHGTARHGTARHGTARHGTARHGTARHGTKYFGSRAAGYSFWLRCRGCIFRDGHSSPHSRLVRYSLR